MKTKDQRPPVEREKYLMIRRENRELRTQVEEMNAKINSEDEQNETIQYLLKSAKTLIDAAEVLIDMRSDSESSKNNQ